MQTKQKPFEGDLFAERQIVLISPCHRPDLFPDLWHWRIIGKKSGGQVWGKGSLFGANLMSATAPTPRPRGYGESIEDAIRDVCKTEGLSFFDFFEIEVVERLIAEVGGFPLVAETEPNSYRFGQHCLAEWIWAICESENEAIEWAEENQ